MRIRQYPLRLCAVFMLYVFMPYVFMLYIFMPYVFMLYIFMPYVFYALHFHAPNLIAASFCVTMISSIDTPKIADSAIRLSRFGIAAPCCHL